MRNRTESPSLSNRTFSDRTAFEAIRNADNGGRIVDPKISPINLSRSPDISITEFTLPTKPTILFSASSAQSHTREGSQPRKITPLNQMSIAQLDELSAELRLRKLKRKITPPQYSIVAKEVYSIKKQRKKAKGFRK